MTGLEQNLRYIEREIRFMVKDQYGNPTYAKYADRVIEDACGIPNFCSTVLSSKRPLTAILRAVRGPRGDILMRFFHVRLHNARTDLVLVLVDAINCRTHTDRRSKESYEYFKKLYRKAMKRMTRLITGSKNKESYKSMYRGLRDFAKMYDYDYDEDDDDEIDDYFNGTDEFGDVDYAQACLEAYRDGKTPPEIIVSNKDVRFKLTGNEEVLKEIAEIEAKLGRHLTDAEIDRLLCDEDEDDDLDSDLIAPKKNSDVMIDSIVDMIYNRVAEKLGIVLVKETASEYETLDDFLNREKSMSEDNSTLPVDTEVPGNPTTKALIDMHNRLKNDVPVENSEIVSSTESIEKDESDDSDTDESNDLPPNHELGGNYNDDEFIEVGTSDNLSESNEDEDEVIEVNSNIPSEEVVLESSEELNTEVNSHLEHQQMVDQIITECKLSSTEITDDFKKRIIDYFTRIDIELNNLFVSLVPSNSDDKLFTLLVNIRITGDYEIINMMHINTVILMYLKKIAERFGISENLFDTEINVVDSDSTFDMDLKVLNTFVKNYTSHTIDNLYSAMSAVSAYIYKRLNKLIEVRFINDPRTNELDLYLFNKSDDLSNAEFEEFYRTELDGEGILNEIFEGFCVECYVIYHLITNDTNDEEFFEKLRQVIGYHANKSPLVNRYLHKNEEFISRYLSNNGYGKGEISSSTDISTGRKNVIVDNIYRIFTKPIVEHQKQDELETELDITGDYGAQLESVLRVISMNTQVSNFIEYYEYDDNDNIDDEPVEEIDDTPKTSNFGI